MKFYLAPMEGLTGYIYRQAYYDCFHNLDKYFTPFISPTQNGCFNPKEERDIIPKHNRGLPVIPQILANNSQYFLETAKALLEFGYEEINLNLGCPSGTVVSKKKGSGFLTETDALDRFLDQVYRGLEPLSMKLSIKTRLGKYDPDEWYELMEIYNSYPVSELIIHPRIQKDYYKNTPRMEVFQDALRDSRIPVCYNGDIRTKEDFERLQGDCPSVDMVMIGRGILADPGLVAKIRGEKVPDKQQIREFHDRIYYGYQEILSGNKNALFKMKELWSYMIDSFEDGEKLGKKIKKAEKLSDYEAAVDDLFAKKELK